MSIHQTYAVFGLGRYGLAVAKELIRSGAEVIAIDRDETVINDAIDEIPICKCADVTDEDVIKNLGISNIDVVVVAMAGCLESSVMAVTLCKEAGVGTVIAKCSCEMHGKILLRVGADRVVIPENESGTRLAKNLVSSGFVDLVELTKDFSMVEIDVKPEWVGKTLLQLKMRKKYSLNVVAIRQGERLSIEIDPEMPLDEEMKLVVIAKNSVLGRLG